MPDVTPHALWKSLCRMVESKPFVRRFGASFASTLDSYAIFEIVGEQSDEISKTSLSIDEEHPVPPFPFPKMLLLFPDYVILLEQPEMDLTTSVLEYQSALFYLTNAKHQEVGFATIRFDVQKSLAQGEIICEVLNMRSHLQLDEGRRICNFPEEEGLVFNDVEAELVRRSQDAQDLAKLDADERATIERLAQELQAMKETHREAIHSYMRATFRVGLQAIAWINRPKHFIVEQGAEVTRKKGKKDQDRIPRLGERSRHIIVSHEEIRRRWSEAQGTHASPMPHLRRGHFKTLRAERFKENRGKVIWVSPCHVNGACVEWRQGAVTYKVVG